MHNILNFLDEDSWENGDDDKNRLWFVIVHSSLQRYYNLGFKVNNSSSFLWRKIHLFCEDSVERLDGQKESIEKRNFTDPHWERIASGKSGVSPFSLNVEILVKNKKDDSSDFSLSSS